MGATTDAVEYDSDDVGNISAQPFYLNYGTVLISTT